MVKHIILWKLKDSYTAEEKAACAAEAKSRLEALNGQIPGLRSLGVRTDALSSSTAAMRLDSAFDAAAALAGYQVHPLHVAAATYVRSVVESRLCLDYEA